MAVIKYINLGSGQDIQRGDGWINYDIIPQEEIVQRLDVEKENIPLGDNTISYIKANDVLEHFVNLRHVLNECHRVLSSEGVLHAEVPRFPHDDSVKDPTHVRFFIPETFKYFSDYKSACEMYGFKQWVRIMQEDREHRIIVEMKPIK